VANFITLSRYPLLLVFFFMVYSGDYVVLTWSVPLLLVAILLDSVDGIVARATGAASLLGSVLDIALDRTYELAAWVILVDLDMIPVAIPLIVIIRTTITDALRGIGINKGLQPFDQHKTSLGKFLVKSRWMRSGYGTSKVVAFCGLFLTYAFMQYPQGSWQIKAVSGMLPSYQFIAWIAVAFCVVRGLPIIVGFIRPQVGVNAAQDRKH